MKTQGALLLKLGFQNYRDYGRFLAKAIGKDKFVQVHLAESGTHQKWDGVRVRVFSKVHGEIGNEAFRFSDHLEKGKTKNEYAKDTELHVWYSRENGYEFYIVEPKSPGVLCVLVEEWLDEWRD